MRNPFSKVQSGRGITSGFHVGTCGHTHADTIHEEKERKFRLVWRASPLFLLEEHKGALAEMSAVKSMHDLPGASQIFKELMSMEFMTSWLVLESRLGDWRLLQNKAAVMGMRKAVFWVITKGLHFAKEQKSFCESQRANSVYLAEQVKWEFI